MDFNVLRAMTLSPSSSLTWSTRLANGYQPVSNLVGSALFGRRWCWTQVVDRQATFPTCRLSLRKSGCVGVSMQMRTGDRRLEGNLNTLHEIPGDSRTLCPEYLP